MPTHAMIARGVSRRVPDHQKAQEGERGRQFGRYVDMEGWPTTTGKSVWNIVKNRFGGNVDRAIEYLIDKHPRGWIDLIEWQTPNCYCHPKGSYVFREGPIDLDEHNSLKIGCEWSYVLYPYSEGMLIYRAVTAEGQPLAASEDAIERPGNHWSMRAILSFRGREPEWEEIEISDMKLMHNLR